MQTVVSRSWDQLQAQEGLSDEHYKVLHREERRPQIVERIQYNEVQYERVREKREIAVLVCRLGATTRFAGRDWC